MRMKEKQKKIYIFLLSSDENFSICGFYLENKEKESYKNCTQFIYADII